MSTSEPSLFSVLLYSLTEEIVSGVCKVLIVGPLLLSRYRPFAYCMKGRFYTFVSHILTPVSVCLPIVFLRYYFEQHYMLILNWHHMQFYSIGTYIQSLVIGYVFFLLFEQPIQSYQQIFKSRFVKILTVDFNKKLKAN